MERESPSPSSDEIEDLGFEILAFLTENPNARDTLEGIAEWWLLEQDLRREKRKVRKALTRLVADGLVLEKQRPDGRTHFQLDDGMLREIRKRIAERSS